MRRAMTAMVCCLAMMMVFTGCEVVSVNREKDMQQVVAQVGDTKILKQEIYEEAASALAADDIDIYSDSLSADLRTQIDAYLLELLGYRIDEEVQAQMAATMGITLTEEEITEAETEAEEYFDLYKMYYLGYDKDHPEDYEGEDIEADLDELLQQQGYENKDAYIQGVKDNKLATKLQEEATKDVTATDEQVKERYDTDLQAQKDVFAAVTDTPEASEQPTSPADEEASAEEDDPDSQYQTLAEAGSNGSGGYVLYKPSGYKIVKHILLELKEDDQALIDAIDEKIEEINAEISPISSDLYDAETAKADAEELIAQLKGEADPEETEATPEDMSTDAQVTEELDIENMTDEEKEAAIEEQQAIVDEQTAAIEALNEKMAPYQTQLSDANAEREEARTQAAGNLQPTVNEIVAKYEGGTDFNDLIDEYNTDPGMEDGAGAAYGYLITPDGAGFVTEFSDASLALSTVGELSDAVQSDHGVHIIRLEMDDNEADMPFEKAQSVVKSKVESELKTEKWNELMDTTWSEELGTKIYESKLNWLK